MESSSSLLSTKETDRAGHSSTFKFLICCVLNVFIVNGSIDTLNFI